MEKMVFFNTTWMDYYEGKEKKVYMGGSYVERNGYGGEIYNFKNIKGKVYGYVQPMGRNNLERLGAKKNAESLSGVLVIFTATHGEGGTYIVGWYKNATVYRDYQETRMEERIYNDEYIGYYAVANAEDVILLDKDERVGVFEQIPKGKGGMGRSNVWYADSDNMHDFRKKVLDFIDKYEEGKIKTVSRINRLKDSILKKKVEVAAIEKVTDYYTKLGYDVKSVETDNVGWDLEVRLKRMLLRVEVKGTSSSDILVNLTPNEYKNMQLYKESYRLAILTSALNDPILHIFSFSQEKNKWIDGYGNTLEIENIISARCFI